MTNALFSPPGDFEAPTRSSDTQHTGRAAGLTGQAVPALTILAHPDARRIGDLTALPAGTTLLARAAPSFTRADSRALALPLTSDFLSKTPSVQFTVTESAITLARGSSDHIVRVEGEELLDTRVFPWPELEAGIVLTVGSRFAFCLHSLRIPIHRGPKMDFIGDSDAMERVRSTIRRLADQDVPVLIRGESGTGKELVASALHNSGRRASGPFVQLNMGELGSTAAAELFGHEKGAFTGAVSDRPGYFTKAHTGTILLDEIGLASLDLQKMLLRVVEDGQVRPVGGRNPRRVDVRIIAATDADLEADMQARRFHGPLYMRLAGFPIWLPALRERRQDIGMLLHHFLERSLAKLGAEHCLDQRAAKHPWLSANAIARLARLDWPGNIRSLRNVAQQIAIDYYDQPEVDIQRALSSALGTPGGAAEPKAPSSRLLTAAPHHQPDAIVPQRVAPSSLTRDQVEFVLQQHEGNMTAAAKALGIAKGSLYELTRRHDIVTTTRISTEDLLAAHRELRGDVQAISRRFGVSLRALQLRLRSLGLPSRPSDDEIG